MRRLFCILPVIILFFLSSGCKQSTELSEGESAIIVNTLMERTDEWGEAARNLDTEKVIDLFMNSEELWHAENGEIFPSYSALDKFVTDFCESTEKMDFKWVERQVFPLANDAAVMSGVFTFEAIQQSGDVFSGRNAITYVFIKRDNTWKIIHGHESTAPSSQTE